MKKKSINWGEAGINIVFAWMILCAWVPEMRPSVFSESEFRLYVLIVLMARFSVLAVKHYFEEPPDGNRH